MDECELFRMIPKEKIDEVFEKSYSVSGECDHTFLGFEEVYKAVTLFTQKDTVIIDIGCAYAFQSWYFRNYDKYIGVTLDLQYNDVLHTDNSEFYFMSGQEFIKYAFPALGIKKEKCFAICFYVPDWELQEQVRNFFPY